MISLKKYNTIIQLSRFTGVGLSAMFVHWCTVLFLVSEGYAPLVANIFAFFIAFQLSYWGHRYWTFDQSTLPHRVALRRFFSIALFGFLLNQFLFWCFLIFSSLSYEWALFLVLWIVALNNFICAKFWAFRA